MNISKKIMTVSASLLLFLTACGGTDSSESQTAGNDAGSSGAEAVTAAEATRQTRVITAKAVPTDPPITDKMFNVYGVGMNINLDSQWNYEEGEGQYTGSIETTP
ncbi:MAG: hypothetical protein ACI4JB_00790, partial [Porcipelethomonas sp.]